MPKAANPALSTKVGDEALKKATGRDWADWVSRLDKAGAAGMTHGEIAEHLHATEGVGDWWAQMVTVGYEQARGRRVKHQRPDGFSVSGSKTIAASPEEVFAAFTRPRRRAAWLPGADLDIRKSTEFKSVRITWNAGTGVKGERGTSVEVNLDAKAGASGGVKTSAQVQHSKIADAASAEKIKAWWKQRLEALKAMLEE